MSLECVSNANKVPYYHREYAHDVGKEKEAHAWMDEGKRIALVALPFLSLYKPLSFPLSLAMGAVRTWTCITDLVGNIQKGSATEIAYSCLQTAIAVVALACTIFAHPLGMLVTTIHDLVLECYYFIEQLLAGNFEKAFQHCLGVVNNAFYLALLLRGGFELLIVSLALQILVGVSQSVVDFKKRNYLEAIAHILMGGVRISQMYCQIKSASNNQITLINAQEEPVKAVVTSKHIVLNVQKNVSDSLTPPQPGQNPVIYHSDKDKQLRELLLKSIKEAKKSVLIMTFTFSDTQIIELLNQRAAEGLNITIIIDKIHRATVDQHNVGGKLKVFTRPSGEGHLHHKIMVLDDETVWLGSANFSPLALTTQDNVMVGLHSTEIAKAIHEEAQVFMGLKKREAKLPPTFMIGNQKVELLLFPNIPDKNNAAEKFMNSKGKQRIIEIIDQAKTEIKIAVPIWTEKDLMEAVIRAKSRGVDVKILLSNAQENQKVFEVFNKALISWKINPNIELLHDKMLWVDRTTLVNGSANWSNSWFTRNDESYFILHELSEAQDLYLSAYWKDLYWKEALQKVVVLNAEPQHLEPAINE